MGVKRAMVGLVVIPVLVLGAQSAEVCGPELTRLWTPPYPQLGRYEVCTSPRPLAEIAGAGWKVEAAAPLDALGTAGTFDKAAVVRLYGGRRPTVARGWSFDEGQFQAITLVSPYPNRQLTSLEPGTLIVRYFVIE